ncbi:hypothetical protein BJX64DRAFT_41596 [Aspergillus heterothallicus]
MTCAELIDLFPSYWWLVGSLRKIFFLTHMPQGPMRTIAAIVGEPFNTRKPIPIDSNLESRIVNARYVVDWDPLSFLETQDYSVDPGDIIERVITMTGTLGDAQALTCAQYMRQTWPSFGDCLLMMLKTVMRTPESRSWSTVIKEKNSELAICGFISDSTLHIDARGLLESMARVG